MTSENKSARHKVMDLLARRPYSELELRKKLSGSYNDDEIEEALETAKGKGWLPAPEELSEQLVSELGRKNKGHEFINHALESRGLPAVAKDSEGELAKAKALLQSKFKIDFEGHPRLTPQDQAKAQRFLMSRGFDEDTILTLLPD